MRELTQSEFIAVGGGGFLSRIGASVGDLIGSTIYAFVPQLAIKIPFVGEIDVKEYFPNLGSDTGKTIGSTIGSAVENIGSHIPIFGGLINKLMGN